MTKINQRWKDDEKNPAKINRADYSPSRPLGVEICMQILNKLIVQENIITFASITVSGLV